MGRFLMTLIQSRRKNTTAISSVFLMCLIALSGCNSGMPATGQASHNTTLAGCLSVSDDDPCAGGFGATREAQGTECTTSAGTGECVWNGEPYGSSCTCVVSTPATGCCVYASVANGSCDDSVRGELTCIGGQFTATCFDNIARSSCPAE